VTPATSVVRSAPDAQNFARAVAMLGQALAAFTLDHERP